MQVSWAGLASSWLQIKKIKQRAILASPILDNVPILNRDTVGAGVGRGRLCPHWDTAQNVYCTRLWVRAGAPRHTLSFLHPWLTSGVSSPL